MDAKTFISRKHDAAIEELKALEAEFNVRKKSAQETIDMAKKWLEELGGEKDKPEVQASAQDPGKAASENWVSARDLTGRTGN